MICSYLDTSFEWLGTCMHLLDIDMKAILLINHHDI